MEQITAYYDEGATKVIHTKLYKSGEWNQGGETKSKHRDLKQVLWNDDLRLRF